MKNINFKIFTLILIFSILFLQVSSFKSYALNQTRLDEFKTVNISSIEFCPTPPDQKNNLFLSELKTWIYKSLKFIQENCLSGIDLAQINNKTLSDFIPKDLFKAEDEYLNKIGDDNLIYFRKSNPYGSLIIKLEVLLNKNKQLKQYHRKNYSYEFKEKPTSLSQEEALVLANKFINELMDKNIKLDKVPNLYKSYTKRDFMKDMEIRIRNTS